MPEKSAVAAVDNTDGDTGAAVAAAVVGGDIAAAAAVDAAGAAAVAADTVADKHGVLGLEWKLQLVSQTCQKHGCGLDG